MKRVLTILVALMCTCSVMNAGKTPAEKMGFKLCVQSYTFHNFTLMETFDKVQSLGVKYIEVFPGHRLGGRWGDQAFDQNIDVATQKELMACAKAKGIKLVGCGVFVNDDIAEWEKLFRVAKNMKMEFISCEPELPMWDQVEALSVQYGIKVSVHNHPQPSAYWHPQHLLEAISDRSRRIGSCADVGHWKREGLDHLQCMRMLQGRIISLHFKDIVAKSAEEAEQHDCIWGQGILDMPAMLQILREQKFKGYLSIEYEYNWDNSVPDIRQSIDYFNRVVGNIKNGAALL